MIAFFFYSQFRSNQQHCKPKNTMQFIIILQNFWIWLKTLHFWFFRKFCSRSLLESSFPSRLWSTHFISRQYVRFYHWNFWTFLTLFKINTLQKSSPILRKFLLLCKTIYLLKNASCIFEISCFKPTVRYNWPKVTSTSLYNSYLCFTS